MRTDLASQNDARLDELTEPIAVIVRAWPLEWVNGEPLDSDGVEAKIHALRSQLDLELFAGFRTDRWPDTSTAALNLADSAYAVDVNLGLTVSLQIRDLIFEQGMNIADPAVLRDLATTHGLTPPHTDPVDGVKADFDEGRRRGVRGSPDFWIDGEDFFCPTLELGHDDSHSLTARFDSSGLQTMLDRLAA